MIGISALVRVSHSQLEVPGQIRFGQGIKLYKDQLGDMELSVGGHGTFSWGTWNFQLGAWTL